MKLSKAIKVLDLTLKNPYHFEAPDTRVAMEIGYQAIQRQQKLRSMGIEQSLTLLPGETPEEGVEDDRR